MASSIGGFLQVHIGDQMHGYQARLDLWYRRVWDLQGLWLDPEGA